MNNIIYQLDFHPDAIAEFNEAYSWYEIKEKGLGDKFILCVKNKLDIIVSMPEAFSVKLNKQYREALVDKFPYTIAFKIISKNHIIFICSIHHQKKHPDKKYR